MSNVVKLAEASLITVTLPGTTLVNASAVTTAAQDAEIALAISAYGVTRVIQEAAVCAARSGDRYYRTCLAVGAAKGVYCLPATSDGRYPSKAAEVQELLSAVSLDSTNGQRKQMSKILGYAWRIATMGHDPFSFPSISGMEDALKGKGREKKMSTDESTVSRSEAERLEAERLEAERLEAERLEAERLAKIESRLAAEHAAELAAAAAAAEDAICSLKRDLMTALYGSAAAKTDLREKYPRAA